MGGMDRDYNRDERQMAFLRVGLYSGTAFGAVVIFLGLAFSHRLVLAIVAAAIFLAVDLPFSAFVLKTARKNQDKRSSGSSFKPLK